jgi:hypothetical protein
MNEPHGAPAPWVPVGRVEVVLDRGKAQGTFAIQDLPGSTGEWEYIFVAHVPSVDLTATAQSPLAVTFAGLEDARWSTRAASVEDEVELLADFVGTPPAGAKPHFKIFDFDDRNGDHALVAEIDGEVRDGKARAKWKVVPPKFDRNATAAGLAAQGFDHPDLFFEVTLGSQKADSGESPDQALIVSDVIDRIIVDEAQEKLPGAAYEVTLSNGQVRRGKLDAESRLFERSVPPGHFDIRILKSLRKAPPPVPPQQPKRKYAPADAARREAFRAPAGRIAAFSFEPRLVRAGGRVKLRARLPGAQDGEPVTFRLTALGGARPFAEVRASVSGGTAEAAFSPSAAGSFDVEVAYQDHSRSTRGGAVHLVVAPTK